MRILIFAPLLTALLCWVSTGMAQQESLGDLAKRVQTEKAQKTRQEKSIDVWEGRLTFRAAPRFIEAQRTLVNRTEINIRNSSARAYRFVFVVKCGDWSKSILGNIESSSGPPSEKAIPVDLASPCKWSDLSLEQIREAEGLEGLEPQPSKVLGIDDAELARQATVQRVVEVPSPANSFESALDRAIDVLTSTNAALAGAHVCTAAAFELLKQVAPQTLDVFRRVEAFNSSDIAAALVLAPPSLRARVDAKLAQYSALAERSHELQHVVLLYVGKCP